VDASHPYLEVLRQAAIGRGYETRQTRIEGDFTDVADHVEPATVVTLDKVICCYPDMVTLVRASARKAMALKALSSRGTRRGCAPQSVSSTGSCGGCCAAGSRRSFIRTARSTKCAAKRDCAWIGVVAA
jgi:hypothetical protein